jgi:hypothetical protein
MDAAHRPPTPDKIVRIMLDRITLAVEPTTVTHNVNLTLVNMDTPATARLARSARRAQDASATLLERLRKGNTKFAKPTGE